MEVRYGSLKRTHSAKSIGGMGSRSSSRNNSFVDLPLIAMPGIGSRVSINNVTSESQLDLQELFKHGEPIHIEAVTVEGGWTCPLVFSMLGALLSSLCFGYNNANMNTQASIMRDALGIPSALPDDCVPPGTPHSLPANDALWGFVVSGFCLSALLGSGGAGRIADRHGRRVFLLANSLLYILAGLAEGAASLVPCSSSSVTQGQAPQGIDHCAPTPCTNALALLLVGRLLTGVACGGSTVVVPMYLGEIAPAHLRGTLGSAFLLTAVTGMLCGQLAGLPSFLGTDALWGFIFTGVLVPALLQLLLFQPLLVESPRWLLMVGSDDAAAEALARLRGCTSTDIELIEELESMGIEGAADAIESTKHARLSSTIDQALLEPMMASGGVGGGKRRQGPPGSSGPPSGAASPSTIQLLIQPSLRRPLGVCLILMAAQQLSGINNAFNYSSSFFVANGLSAEDVTSIAIAMNVGNVLVVLLSTCLMDRVGRRVLLLSSMGGMVVAIALLTLALQLGLVTLVEVATVLFVISFGLGLGPVVWLLPAELFPMSRRAPATAVVTAVNWLFNYLVGQTFPLVATWLGPLSFLPFAFVLIAAWLFAWHSVPETRGKTLEQIEAMLREPVMRVAGRSGGMRR